MTTTKLTLLRHGACEGGDILRGVTDSQLSEIGYAQMQAAVTGQSHWQHIISSPLQRCSHFAVKLATQLELPVDRLEALAEMDFGDWEGLELAKLQQTHPDQLKCFWSQPEVFTPPQGESLIVFSDRVASAWQQLLDTHRGKQVLVITHGGVIRSLIGHCLKMPLTGLRHLSIPYACITEIHVHHQTGRNDWPQLVRLAGTPES